jgi:hypothetical protein
MTPVNAQSPWQPVYGDDIGPSVPQRVRTGVTLGVVLVVLGVLLAAGLGLTVVALFGLFGAAVG